MLQAAGIHDPDLMLMEDEPTSVALGCRLFSELLARAPDVDAVLCQNDDLALGVLFECQRRGISVPGDLGICGINNLEFAASSHPAITTVDIPRFELGFEAADLLIQAIGGGSGQPAQAGLQAARAWNDAVRGEVRARHLPCAVLSDVACCVRPEIGCL